jgi:Nitronate monooxygenase
LLQNQKIIRMRWHNGARAGIEQQRLPQAAKLLNGAATAAWLAPREACLHAAVEGNSLHLQQCPEKCHRHMAPCDSETPRQWRETMLHTQIWDLLGIEFPIIQAGMSRFTSAELVAAVSNAGGLGSLGCDLRSLEDLTTQLARTRELTSRTFAVNHLLLTLTKQLSP